MKRTAINRRTPLRRVSKKRAREQRIYAQKRKAFLEANPICWVWAANNVVKMIEGETTKAHRSTEVHHKNGRTGKNYLDESTWMAVSAKGHCWIHQNPKEARAKGWITT